MRRGVGQARVGQPDRLVQGPHGAGDDRGRRASRRPAARPDRRRVHRRQHRQLARLRLRGQGLPACGSSARTPSPPRSSRRWRAFGADVELIPSPQGITPDLIPAMMRRAARDRRRGRGASPTDQFNNRDTLDGYRAIGDGDRCDQLRGPIDAFCRLRRRRRAASSASPRCSRRRSPAIERIAVEPAESAVLSGGTPGTHRIEGGGVGLRAAAAAAATSTRRGRRHRRGAWRWPVGRLARRAVDRPVGRRQPRRRAAGGRELGQGRRVATVLVDSGLKYLGGSLYA